MSGFTDYHAHFVYGVDDGAQTREEMYAMLDAAAADGVRHLFATSHSTPGMERFPQEVYDRHLALARAYCTQKGYDLKLEHGSELLYTPATGYAAVQRQLLTLGDTGWVLLEFVPNITAKELETALQEITGAGYRILVAHIERYPCLAQHGLLARLHEQYRLRCQINCSAVLDSGFWQRMRLEHWVKAGLVDAISSDAHNCTSRPTRMRQGPMDAAFLNLEMPGMNGLALTRMIQKLQPRCNIIVVTEHPEYALEALQIFVSGFLLKPANEADVRNVLEHLRYPPENAPVGIKIQCFGNFEIFVGGRALAFKRSKSKELLAYLVDRNGATCTNGEMLAVLWEDKPDTASLHSHLRNLIFDLSHTLEDAGVTGLLIRGRSTLALDTSKVDCDYYNFLRGSRSATNFYRGEYMTQYSWAEVTRSALRQQANVQKTASIPSYYVPPTGF